MSERMGGALRGRAGADGESDGGTNHRGGIETAAPWLSSPSGRYVITAFDESGGARATRAEGAASWKENTRVLAPNKLALFEVAPEK